MFGRKKKKDETPDAPEADKKDKKKSAKGKEDESAVSENPEGGEKKKKKFLSLKKLLFIFLAILAISIAGFVVYRIYFSTPEEGVVQYHERELTHVTLPEEIIRFSFDFMPPIYDLIIVYNTQIALMEQEISRIGSVAEAYPNQKKIAEKEQKIWSKERDKLTKFYEKLEKKIEALYVSYRVNRETGIQQINEQQGEITKSLQDALIAPMALTQRLESTEVEIIPDGFIGGNIYKIKRMISNLMD